MDLTKVAPGTDMDLTKVAPGTDVMVRRSWDKRASRATFLGLRDDGRVSIRTWHRAARGGGWTDSLAIVRPSDVLRLA